MGACASRQGQDWVLTDGMVMPERLTTHIGTQERYRYTYIYIEANRRGYAEGIQGPGLTQGLFNKGICKGETRLWLLDFRSQKATSPQLSLSLCSHLFQVCLLGVTVFILAPNGALHV